MPTGSRGRPALLPLHYALETVDGLRVVAYDPIGAGRIAEVFGNLDDADHIAVVVPGNAHDLASYRTHTGGASPRRNGIALHDALQAQAPKRRCAVIVWLGYACPRGFLAGANRGAAEAGARDLRTLVHWLPAAARITVIGHSYGSLVGAVAASGGDRIDDLVALASPGLGVWHVSELRTSTRVWAARHPQDWVRSFPRLRIAAYGHGRQPTDPGFGARVLATDVAGGHDTYYRRDGTTLANLVHIVMGNHTDVEVVGPTPDRLAARR